MTTASAQTAHGLEAPCLDPGRVTVVLVFPRFAENVGAVARALANFGGAELRLVRPNAVTRAGIAERVARAGEPFLRDARTFGTLDEAVAGFDLILATSHRGGRRRALMTPWEVTRDLVPALNPRHVALVLGPEDRGLKATEIRACHRLVSIPSQSSLNLAQAAILLLYELCVRPAFGQAAAGGPASGAAAAVSLSLGAPPPVESPEGPAAAAGLCPSDPAPATPADLSVPPDPPAAVPRIVAAAADALTRVGYPHHRKPMQTEMARLADILARARPDRYETNFLIGMFRQIERWAREAEETGSLPAAVEPPPP